MRVDIIFTPEQTKQGAKELGVTLRDNFNGPNFLEVLQWGFSPYYYPANDIARVKVYEEDDNV